MPFHLTLLLGARSI